MVAAHMQLATLGGPGVPPLVLTPDVEDWFDQQLEAARAATAPALPRATVMAVRTEQQLRPGSPSLGQKRKWQAGSPPSPVANESAVGAWPGPAHRQTGPPQVSPFSKLPLWQRLQQALLAEQDCEVGLNQHAIEAAACKVILQGPALPEQNGGDDEAGCVLARTGTLAQLRQAAASERTATERLLQLNLL